MRPLAEEYSLFWICVCCDRVRIEERNVTLALIVAHGVSSPGGNLGD